MIYAILIWTITLFIICLVTICKMSQDANRYTIERTLIRPSLFEKLYTNKNKTFLLLLKTKNINFLD